ncbi:MAG: acyl-CoA dehydrogenase family protein [Chloroflexi bacterium]|nr:acyl-CoA dehydrogenase family protein [Chloroflexota bacterium]
MDFELHYSEGQEEFRKEVWTWLEANVPRFDLSSDGAKQSMAARQGAADFRRKLGTKGWLAPNWPKEYGGGGLSLAETIVIDEELSQWDVASTGDLGLSLGAPAIMVWGTEEQKKRFLPPILKGEITTWQCFTEPEAGSDLASLKTRAEWNGSEYVINGQKIFIGSPFPPDYIYTLAVTDPEAPRHRNIGAFIIPAKSPGVTIQPLKLIAGGGRNTIFYDNVRVSPDQLIGGKTDGWRVAQSTLEVEHGGGGRVVARDQVVDDLLAYYKEAKRSGKPLSRDSHIKERLVDLYIQSEIGRLFGLRGYWMRATKTRLVGYEGSQNALHGKKYFVNLATILLEVLGPTALVDDPKWAPLKGNLEYYQRFAACQHQGGTPEIQKVIIARRMGVSRTRETAAAMV